MNYLTISKIAKESIVLIDGGTLYWLITERIFSLIWKDMRKLFLNILIADETFDRIFRYIETTFMSEGDINNKNSSFQELFEVKNLVMDCKSLISIQNEKNEVSHLVSTIGIEEAEVKILEPITLIKKVSQSVNHVIFVSDSPIVKGLIKELADKIDNLDFSKVMYMPTYRFVLFFYEKCTLNYKQYDKFSSEYFTERELPDIVSRENWQEMIKSAPQDFSKAHVRKNFDIDGHIKYESIEFENYLSKNRIVLAQIPSIMPESLSDEKLLTEQKEKIKDIIIKSISSDCNFIIFPEISCPFKFIDYFDDLIKNADKEIICVFPYNHIKLADFVNKFDIDESSGIYNLNESNSKHQVNFIRICIKTNNDFNSFNQLKLNPYSKESSLDARTQLKKGERIYTFRTNWGNFLFLICKDYLICDTDNAFRQPIVHIIGRISEYFESLNGENLDYIFVSTCNKEQKVFIEQTLALYSSFIGNTKILFLFVNDSSFGESLIVSPLSHHPNLKFPNNSYKIEQFSTNLVEKGTVITFPTIKELIGMWDIYRVNKYQSVASSSTLSPIVLVSDNNGNIT